MNFKKQYCCKDCRNHVTTKQFPEYCWCNVNGYVTTQSIYKKACDSFAKLYLLDALEALERDNDKENQNELT